MRTGLAVDLDNPNILYASSQEGLLKNTDNALHWQAVETNLSLDINRFFSLETFVTQTLRALTNPDTPTEIGMAISPANINSPNTLYGVTHDFSDFHPPSSRFPSHSEFLFKSNDEGYSWINITASEKKYNSGFTIDPNNSEKLYATFAETIFGRNEILMTSNNGGEDWKPVGRISEHSVEFFIPKV